MLGLELTRRCNMQCRHCMRGPAQAVDIQKEVIERALDEIPQGRGIDRLLLTGGEPSLVPHKIMEVLENLQSRRLLVGTVSIISNGKGWTEAFANVVNAIGAYALDGVSLLVSVDRYHEVVNTTNHPSFSSDVHIGTKTNDVVLAIGNGKALKEAETTTTLMEKGSVVWGCEGERRSSCDYEFTTIPDNPAPYQGTEILREEVIEELIGALREAEKEDLSKVGHAIWRPILETATRFTLVRGDILNRDKTRKLIVYPLGKAPRYRLNKLGLSMF